MAQISEDMLIDQVKQRLAGAYPDLPADDVVSVVHEAHARLQTSPIREFVPLFVEQRARQELSRSASLLTWSS